MMLQGKLYATRTPNLNEPILGDWSNRNVAQMKYLSVMMGKGLRDKMTALAIKLG